MPVFLLLTFGVFGILTLILMFSSFKNPNSCCSLFRFIFFILLCLILPVVVWSAILVFFPQDEINPQNYRNFWSQNKVNDKLMCDPSFWELNFYVTIASVVVSFILIISTIVAFFKSFTRGCERCCLANNKWKR